MEFSLSKKNGFICFNKSPLKMMKNDFYFMLKPPFVLKIFKYLSWLYYYVGLIKKLRLISKFLMSKTRQQIIAMNI